MFDDCRSFPRSFRALLTAPFADVEHPALAQSVPKPVSLPPLQYEGFEPDDARHGQPVRRSSVIRTTL